CEIDHVLDLVNHGVIEHDRAREALAAVHDAMSDGIDAAESRARLLLTEPAESGLDGSAVITDRCSSRARRPPRDLHPDQGFAANAIDEPARESLIGVVPDAILVSSDDLEFERRRSGV